MGTMEPFQSASTVSGQVEELADIIRARATGAVYLFGHSWGAWISYLLAYSHPELTRKVFLIGSGAFDASYVREMEARRLACFTEEERVEYKQLVEKLSNEREESRDSLLSRLGALAGKSDNYCVDPIPENDDEVLRIDASQYRAVWSEGARLRETGSLIEIAGSIEVPIRVIHCANDPTPVEGVVEPIRALKDLRWYEIARCGYDPWKERYAKDEFWRIVKAELVSQEATHEDDCSR